MSGEFAAECGKERKKERKSARLDTEGTRCTSFEYTHRTGKSRNPVFLDLEGGVLEKRLKEKIF